MAPSATAALNRRAKKRVTKKKAKSPAKKKAAGRKAGKKAAGKKAAKKKAAGKKPAKRKATKKVASRKKTAKKTGKKTAKKPARGTARTGVTKKAAGRVPQGERGPASPAEDWAVSRVSKATPTSAEPPRSPASAGRRPASSLSGAQLLSSRPESPSIPAASTTVEPPGTSAQPAVWRRIKVGIDLGNYRSVVAASKNGEPIEMRRDVFPNVVGYLKLDAPIDGVSGKVDALFDEDAFKYYKQLNFKRPVQAGIVTDVKVCQEFAAHVCSTINPKGNDQLWGVVSAPARATPDEQQRVRRAMRGVLAKTLVVAEPYLAAEGMHLDENFRRTGRGRDLTRGSLVVDIGATTTDLCLVRGKPTALNHIVLEKGGHWIDKKILSNALFLCSGISLTPKLAVEVKEEQAFVNSESQRPVTARSELIALTEVIRGACEDLVQTIVDASCEFLGRCDPESAVDISRNVIVTGGGSKIRGLPGKLRSLLRARGYEEAEVLVPANYKRLVAHGALRVAEKLSDEEWDEMAEQSWHPLTLPGGEGGDTPVEPGLSAIWDDVSAPAVPGPFAGPGPDITAPTPDTVLEDHFDLKELDDLELYKALEPRD